MLAGNSIHRLKSSLSQRNGANEGENRGIMAVKHDILTPRAQNMSGRKSSLKTWS